jgi:hypothetical protein
MKSVAAGAIALAIGAILVITLVNHENTENATLPPGGTKGYSQGKYDAIKPLPGTTNVPINPYNKSVPSAEPQGSGGSGASDMGDDLDALGAER